MIKVSFKEVERLDHTLNGLWQSIHVTDYDGDGDTDLLLGNWGLNSKFKASDKHPLRMYYADFDANKQTENCSGILQKWRLLSCK